MYINIHYRRINFKMDCRKRIVMWHYIAFICFLYCFCNYWTFNIPPIDIIIFIATVSTADNRFSYKSCYFNILCLTGYFHKVWCNITTVHTINYIFKIHISGCVEFILVIIYKTKRYVRMWQAQMFYKCIDISCFCCGSL